MAKTIYVADYLFGKASLNRAVVAQEDAAGYTLDPATIEPLFGTKLETWRVARRAMCRRVEETPEAATRWLEECVLTNLGGVRAHEQALVALLESISLLNLGAQIKTRDAWSNDPEEER